MLIRDPWRGWANPLDPDELAELAGEDDVEARLITRARGKWRVEHGPIAAARFAKLPAKDWTLLVQAVDHHVPAVAALIDAFRFIPNWRIDDVMVSYATDGGGVGPHFDQYDVFLIQGLGQRRWRIGQRCDAATPLLPHDDLRLLADFEATDEWVLGPGDILYVPPGVAHEGVAIGGDCMTYSVGFRAPSRSDLVAGWCDHVLDTLRDDDRYADPDLVAQANPGEIAPAAIARMHAMVTDALSDHAAFARWLGTSNSAPKADDADWSPDAATGEDAVRARLEAGTALDRNPASRFSFIRGEAGVLTLFVDGEAHDCAGTDAAFAERLCASSRVATGPEFAPVAVLIAQLINRGSVAFDDA